jgi:hypothetical protein
MSEATGHAEASGGPGAAAPLGPEGWAQRFEHQGDACAEIGSPLYARLLHLLAAEIRAATATWDVMAARADLRFGQAGPLRLVGTAHRLALAGEAPEWAEVLPSCGGEPPEADEALLVAWRVLVDLHADRLVEGLSREVQTNEVARAGGLGLALAETGFTSCDLVELGCSGGLNLRLDHFDIEVGGLALGRVESPVQLRPELRGHLGALRHEGLVMPQVGRRVGIDPHPVDPDTDDGRLTLLSYVWPDQALRLARVEAAIELARRIPAELIEVGAHGQPDTAEALSAVLEAGVPTVVQQSIMWQYVPVEQRWHITEAMEQRGERATEEAPLGWVRFEPDEWDRRRAAVWLRRWPGGGDHLVAHIDYHGRWLAPAR